MARRFLNGINKSDAGLGNVDNTSDANKPVSTAAQTELNKKPEFLVWNGTSYANKSDGKIFVGPLTSDPGAAAPDGTVWVAYQT